MNTKPLLCARHRARCFMSIILFNPHDSPPCLQMRKLLLRARLLHPKLLEKIPQLHAGPHLGPQLHPMVFINSPAGPPLSVPSPPLQTFACLCKQHRHTLLLFSVGDLASHSWRKQRGAGRFSDSSPLQPINLSTETPQVRCEMRQCKINT